MRATTICSLRRIRFYHNRSTGLGGIGAIFKSNGRADQSDDQHVVARGHPRGPPGLTLILADHRYSLVSCTLQGSHRWAIMEGQPC
jgi:hypothetical protein